MCSDGKLEQKQQQQHHQTNNKEKKNWNKNCKYRLENDFYDKCRTAPILITWAFDVEKCAQFHIYDTSAFCYYPVITKYTAYNTFISARNSKIE